jgi:integrase
MARQVRSSKLENRTNRLKLASQRKPFFVTVAPGIALGYRRNAGAGTWSVRASDGHGGNWLKGFAVADDHEDSNGATVLDFWQASDKARTLARAGDGDGEKPATVDEALTAYADDLVARGGAAGNVSRIRHNLPSTLAAKVVTLLTAKELRNWRNGLVKAGLKPASADRTARALAAALTLASPVVNATAWKTGLQSLPDSDEARPNVILSDEVVRDIVIAAYGFEPAFGLLIELLQITGARASQILRIKVGDLEDVGAAPRLQVPSSRKGKHRKVTRKPLPIPPRLARALRVAVRGCPDDAPLLMRDDGTPWPRQIDKLFRNVTAKAGLKRSVTPYALRHSSITRALLAGVPVELVASSHDTSAAIISKHYARYITHNSDTLLRNVMLDTGAPAPSNVVTLNVA